jgi:hypothetical protein
MGIPIIGDIIGSVIGKAGDIASEFIVDKDKKAQLAFELERLRVEAEDKAEQRVHEQLVGQIEVNKVEANHRSIFVAGWRPAIGWGCGAALVYNALVAPMFGLGVADLGFLQTILLGMLGISASRTFEKVKGVSNDVLPMRKPKEPVDLVPQVLKDTLPEKTPWE